GCLKVSRSVWPDSELLDVLQIRLDRSVCGMCDETEEIRQNLLSQTQVLPPVAVPECVRLAHRRHRSVADPASDRATNPACEVSGHVRRRMPGASDPP